MSCYSKPNHVLPRFGVAGFVVLIAVSNPPSLVATKIPEKPLAQLVAEADHVVVAKVTRVTMHNRIGWEIKDPKARTGPGLRNELRLHVAVETNGVLKTSKRSFPVQLEIPLWSAWHSSLGSVKGLEGQTFIFLLKGEKMERVYEGYFRRDMSEKTLIQDLIPKQLNAASRSNLMSVSNAVKIASGLHIGMSRADVDKYMQSHGMTQADIQSVSIDRGRTLNYPYPLAADETSLVLEMECGRPPKSGLSGWENPLLKRAYIQSQSEKTISIILTNAP